MLRSFRLAILEGLTQPNALFSVASRANLPELLPTYEWRSRVAAVRGCAW